MPKSNHPAEAEGVSVHAGFPNPATDKAFSALDLNHLLVEHSASTYFFRIEGNDWRDDGIFDGDIAVIDRALSPRPNDLVVWWHSGTAQFAVSACHLMPKQATCWGAITATIHQLRQQPARLQDTADA